jgi:serine protease AprX
VARLKLALFALLVALFALLPAAAALPVGAQASATAKSPVAPSIPPSLLDAAAAAPKAGFAVIVQGDGSDSSDKLARALGHELAKDSGVDDKAVLPQLQNQFASIEGFAATLTGKQIVKLARTDGVASITPDATVTTEGSPSNPQKWIGAMGAAWYWSSPAFRNTGSAAPTIAVVDSGIDNSNGQFGDRILTQVDLGGGQASGDGRGHGTFVASLAAGLGSYSGVAPTANLVSLDVFDRSGIGKTSDVIRACDWILQNKDRYRIRVANLSLTSSIRSSFTNDPLDKAVERLWNAGVVVVAAAGNYASAGQPSGVLYAPANDPFVITVGAVDVNATPSPTDDANAPWSAYGYTPDGFAKPELAAPGRYLVAQLPTSATLFTDFSGNRAAGKNTLQLSGTSFAAPIVAGTAAALLAAHPEYTPDQVKGALMLSATALGKAAARSLGVGEANLQKALAVNGSPPNPNAAVDAFLVSDPAGGSIPVFDADRWTSTAAADASWSSASWSAASWSAASWSAASWSAASWSAASWSAASWSAASWSAASWSADSVANNAAADGTGDG